MPRSGSTAFERMMIERGDHVVLSEPFSAAYYDGPEQRSTRFPVTEPAATVASVAADVLGSAHDARVFVKDMAYHALPGITADVLAHCTNTFLIRDPARSVPSLAKRWPDFTHDEVGFESLAAMVAMVDDLGRDVVIVDNADLRAHPAELVASWCDAVDITFDPAALAWEAGEQPGWERWSDWHESTAGSTGFLAPTDEPVPEVRDARVAAAIADAAPTYEALRARRLRVDAA